MKRFALITSIILALALCALCPKSARAQYVGSISQLTSSQTFTITMAGTITHQDIKVVGQTGHEIFTSQGGPNCDTVLEGSLDGTFYSTIAFVNKDFGAPFAFGSGYFPFLRLAFNETGNAACNSIPITVNYSGFQFPFQPEKAFDAGVASTVGPSVAVSTPVSIVWNGAGTTNLWVMPAFSCYNPNASVAYLQIFDAGVAPTLGASVKYEVGIPASSSFSFAAPKIFGTNGLWAGAATAPGGNTAVATPVQCSFDGEWSGSPFPGWVPGL